MSLSFRSRLFATVLMVFASQSVWAQACYTTKGWGSMQKKSIQLLKGDTVKTWRVRIADNNHKRAAGYQWLCAKDAVQTAVLFVFPNEVSLGFHMRNVFVPLDIYFFDAKGQQVGSFVMRPEPPGIPLKARYYQPKIAFQYALEIARPLEYSLQTKLSRKQLLVDDL